MNKFLFISVTIVITLSSVIQAQIKRETRAVWVSTNFRLDWPPKSYDQEVQKEALLKIFNGIKNKKLNTVYFQVRSMGTVMFRSSFEPFSPYITGDVGGIPDYDPLEFALVAAHKRGLELHAWLNVVRCFLGNEEQILNHPEHIVNKHPEWIVKYYNNGAAEYWLDPGLPGARDYLVNLIIDLVQKYNLDGIHLDYIRYPGSNFDDDDSHSLFGGDLTRDEWRRQNITTLVSEISAGIREINPFIKIGAAPIGIYKNSKDAQGLEGYYDVYQDSRKWLEEKFLDYLTPQIYWGFESNPRFDKVSDDWTANSFGRGIILGIAAYKPEVKNEIERMINYSRELNSQGVAFFRYSNIKDYQFESFSSITLPSLMPWIDNINPKEPQNLTYKFFGTKPQKILLSWEDNSSSGPTNGIEYYALYKFNTISDTGNIFEIIKPNKRFLTLSIEKPRQFKYYFALKSVDKLWNESSQYSNIIEVTIPELFAIKQKTTLKSQPVLIKEKSGKHKLLLYLSKEDVIDLFAGNETEEQKITRREIPAGNNFLTIENDLSGYSFIKVVFKNLGKEARLKL